MASGEDVSWQVRAAAPDDVDQVVRLAGLMYESMGIDPAGQGWRAAAQAAFTRRVGRDLMLFVVELHATAEAENLYRSLGFSQGKSPGLRLSLH